jgi:simple sugar transport system permease protein
MTALFSVVFLLQVLRIAVPYVLAALGGTASERGGVINIALEGMLLSGAFGFVLVTHWTGNPWAGLGGGLLGGELVAVLLAVSVLRFGADAIVAGVGLNLLAAGLTRFLLKLVWDSSSNSERVPSFAEAGLFGNPVFLLTCGLLAVSTAVLFRTRFGLRLRACGEHPEAAASVGIGVTGYRTAGVLLSGLLAGLGGVWLAAEQHQFSDGMSAGRGYIALAAMITGRWHPLGAAAACVLFAVAEGVQMALQGQGTGIPTQLLQMLPHVVTVVTLVGFIGRSRAPAALGRG